MQEYSNRSRAALSTSQQLYIEIGEYTGTVGFGKKIVVPPDEVHVVTGAGRHALIASPETTVYGAYRMGDSASEASLKSVALYFRNPYTQIVPLRKRAFTVEISGDDGLRGIAVLDKNNVRFTVEAEVQAQLRATWEGILLAAEKVGTDPGPSLVAVVQGVTEAQLRAAAARMSLEEVMKDFDLLSNAVEGEVNKTLTGLGYELLYIRIGALGGPAVDKLTQQANAVILANSTIKINEAELRQAEDQREREKREAELKAGTDRKVAEETTAAGRDVRAAQLATKEETDVREHELRLKEAKRRTAASEADQAVQLRQEQLNQLVALEQAQNAAAVALRQQELAKERERHALTIDAQLAMEKQQAELARQAQLQERRLQLAADQTKADAARLREEELEEAQRLAEALALKTEAETKAEALRVQRAAQAAAEKVGLETDAATQAELLKARRDAEAAVARAEAVEVEAKAAKVLAEATKAEKAASGLAEAEVAAAQIANAEKQAAVTLAEGKAQAEVTRELELAKLTAEERRAQLYAESPALLELEILRIKNAHTMELEQARLSAQLQIAQAYAASMKINVFGPGGNGMMSQFMNSAFGLDMLGQEVPFVGSLLNGMGGANGSADGPNVMGLVGRIMPALRSAMKETNSRMWTTLSVSDALDQVVQVASGQTDVVTAVKQLRQQASFKTVADLPVRSLLSLLGVNLPSETDDMPEDIEVVEKQK